MTIKAISELSDGIELAGDEYVPITQDGTTVKVTPTMFADLVRTQALTAELIRDTIGSCLVAGSGISIVVDDSPNTITIALSGGGGGGAFSAITGGTNTSAEMVVGSGASLTVAGTGTINATSAVVENEATDTTCFPLFATAATGDLGMKTNANLTFNSNTGVLGVAGLTVAGQVAVTSSNAAGLAVGLNGATNPVLNVDCSTASQVAGLTIIGKASGAGVEINATGGTNESMTIRSKGNGGFNITGGSSMQMSLALGVAQTLTSTQVSFTNLARSSTTNTGFLYTLLVSGVGGSALTAGTEAHAVYLNLSSVQTHVSNTAITTQRDMRINPSTHGFQTATGTITDAMGVSIDGAPIAGTNCAITNSHALYIGSRAVGAGVAASYGLTVNPMTGGTADYAAQFLGLTGIGRGTPTAWGDFAASTTAAASIRIRSGTAPTSPNDGDLWYDGTDLKFRQSGTTKTITLL